MTYVGDGNALTQSLTSGGSLVQGGPETIGKNIMSASAIGGMVAGSALDMGGTAALKMVRVFLRNSRNMGWCQCGFIQLDIGTATFFFMHSTMRPVVSPVPLRKPRDLPGPFPQALDALSTRSLDGHVNPVLQLHFSMLFANPALIMANPFVVLQQLRTALTHNREQLHLYGNKREDFVNVGRFAIGLIGMTLRSSASFSIGGLLNYTRFFKNLVRAVGAAFGVDADYVYADEDEGKS